MLKATKTLLCVIVYPLWFTVPMGEGSQLPSFAPLCSPFSRLIWDYSLTISNRVHLVAVDNVSLYSSPVFWETQCRKLHRNTQKHTITVNYFTIVLYRFQRFFCFIICPLEIAVFENFSQFRLCQTGKFLPTWPLIMAFSTLFNASYVLFNVFHVFSTLFMPFWCFPRNSKKP